MRNGEEKHSELRCHTGIMASSEEIICSDLLCFVNSAQVDFSNESLFEVTYSFYSHEDIKSAKSALSQLTKKDLPWRRDPEKKKKDLRDVFDLFQDLTAVTPKLKVKFVTDSHKKMPPMGMELIAPIICNLTEEIYKINEILPKITDLKTEVCNTADAVRQIRVDMSHLRKTFSNAIMGLEEAAKDVTSNEDVLHDLTSFRLSEINEAARSTSQSESQQQAVGPPVFHSEAKSTSLEENTSETQPHDINHLIGATRTTTQNEPQQQAFGSPSMLYSDAVSISPDKNTSENHSHFINPLNVGKTHNTGAYDRMKIQNTVGRGRGEMHRGAPPVGRGRGAVRGRTTDGGGSGEFLVRADHTTTDRRRTSEASVLMQPGVQRRPETDSSLDNEQDGWIEINRRRKAQRGKNKGVRGTGKGIGGQVRAVRRTADVFLGRVDHSVTENDIKEHIKDNFDISVLNIEKIEIKSTSFNAFKIAVLLSERDSLFNSDKWPEDMVVDKFYSNKPNIG